MKMEMLLNRLLYLIVFIVISCTERDRRKPVKIQNQEFRECQTLSESLIIKYKEIKKESNKNLDRVESISNFNANNTYTSVGELRLIFYDSLSIQDCMLGNILSISSQIDSLNIRKASENEYYADFILNAQGNNLFLTRDLALVGFEINNNKIRYYACGLKIGDSFASVKKYLTTEKIEFLIENKAVSIPILWNNQFIEESIHLNIVDEKISRIRYQINS